MVIVGLVPAGPAARARTCRSYTRHLTMLSAAERSPTAPPLVHRLARRLALSGWRGAHYYWAAADRIVAWPDSPAVEVVPGVWLAVSQDDFIGSNIYRGLYERAETWLVRRLVSPGDIAVDVGANLGFYTALLTYLTGPNGRVFAVEPAPYCLAALEQLIRDSALSNVTVLPWAAGADAGSANMVDTEHSHNTGLATLRENAEGEHRTSFEVEVWPLDSVPGLRGAEQISLLKIDVEGFEAEVLAGAESMFTSRRLVAAIVEVVPEFGAVDDLAVFFKTHESDYAIYEITEQGRLKRHTVLRRLDPGLLANASHAFNLFAIRRDREDLVMKPMVEVRGGFE